MCTHACVGKPLTVDRHATNLTAQANDKASACMSHCRTTAHKCPRVHRTSVVHTFTLPSLCEELSWKTCNRYLKDSHVCSFWCPFHHQINWVSAKWDNASPATQPASVKPGFDSTAEASPEQYDIFPPAEALATVPVLCPSVALKLQESWHNCDWLRPFPSHYTKGTNEGQAHVCLLVLRQDLAK